MSIEKSRFFKATAVVLTLSFLVVALVPARSLAYVVGSDGFSGSAALSDRGEDLARVQRVLESKMIAKRLEALGLTSEEIDSRLSGLTDGEVHSFAGQLESLYPGGSGLGLLIAVLIIILLVIVILKVADKKIIIE